jgi:hypothetical protein
MYAKQTILLKNATFLLNFRFNLNKTLAACNTVTEPIVIPDAALQD